MMRIFIVVGMLCMMSIASFGQVFSINFNEGSSVKDPVSPVVKEKIEFYALEISKIVIDEKILMNAEISSINGEITAGTISDSEGDSKKAEISSKYSEKINERIDLLEFDLDEITKKQVEYTILNTDVDKLTKEKNFKDLETKYKAKNEVVGFLSYGMMHFEDGDNESLNRHLGYGSGIDFGFLYHKQLNRTSPFTFITGAYFSWRTMRFDDDYMINRSEDGNVSLIQYDKNLEKSKLRSTYIMVPVGIKYSFSSLKKINDEISYRDVNKGIGIGVNVYGGFRINQNNIVKGQEISMREKGTNYNLNNFVYGAQATLSIDNINFFVRQDLSSYFKDNTFDDRKMLQFGINFGF